MSDATISSSQSLPRPAGFVSDLITIQNRSIRAMLKEPEYIIPSLIIPIFFFFVNTGSLGTITEQIGAGNVNAFQLPVAIVFAVTGISRASALVTDIQSGYFDRLLISPVNRYALLLGLMSADLLLVMMLSLIIMIMGLALGVTFTTGILGMLIFMISAGFWGLAFTGFPYAIALKTGNGAAVAASFIIFFPFTFLTTASLPLEYLSWWLKTVATYNPVTYLLAGQRTLISSGWDSVAITNMFIAISFIFVVSFGLAFAALIGRLRSNG